MRHQRAEVRDLRPGHGKGRQVVEVRLRGPVETLLIADLGCLLLEELRVSAQAVFVVIVAEVGAKLVALTVRGVVDQVSGRRLDRWYFRRGMSPELTVVIPTH